MRTYGEKGTTLRSSTFPVLVILGVVYYGVFADTLPSKPEPQELAANQISEGSEHSQQISVSNCGF